MGKEDQMRFGVHAALVAVLSLGSLASSQGASVTVAFTSPQHNASVVGGAAIPWTITASVSTGDNLGLSLFSANILQSVDNPVLLDLRLADPPPAGMSAFARPSGIANPDTIGAGYSGTQVGVQGTRNLYQVGGALNTFGAQVGAIGTDFNVAAHQGVGQSGAQVVATGVFIAPCLLGTYTYSLDAVVANVLESIAAPPGISTASRAEVQIESGSITFTVTSVANCRADFNHDCVVTLQDLFSFLAAYFAGDPRADVDGIGGVTVNDVFVYLALYFAGCP